MSIRQKAIEAARNLKFKEGDDLFDLAGHMSCHSDNRRMNLNPMTLCINLALMSEPSYFERIVASCVVADFILRHMMDQKEEVYYQIKNNIHPFSVVLKENNKIFTLSKSIQKDFKQCYIQLVDMFKDLITSFDSYSNFVRKIKYAIMVF